MPKKGGKSRGEVLWQHSAVSGPAKSPPGRRGEGKSSSPGFQLRQCHDDTPGTTTGYSAERRLGEAFPSLGRDVISAVLESCAYDSEAAMSLLASMCLEDAAPPPPPQPPAAHGSPCRHPPAARAAAWGITMLPSDLLLKLVAFFRPADTLIASQTCWELRRVLGRVLEGVTLLSVTDDSPDRSILTLLRHCPGLDTLKMRGAFKSWLQLSLVSTVRHLKLISLRCCSSLTDADLVSLLQGVQTLDTLQIDSCHLITDNAFGGFYEAAIDQNMLAADSVTGQGLKYAVMAMVGAGMEGAKWVNNGLLQSPEVELVARRLRTLSLRKVNSINELTLKGCMQLTDLSIFMCGILRAITLTQTPHLERLDLNGNNLLSTITCDSTSLTALSLSGCRRVDAIALSTARLTAANLYGCMSVSDACVHKITASSSSTLESLSLDGCSSVMRLHLTAPALATLCLKGCQSIADLQLSKCTALRSLDVRNCASLSPVRIDGECRVSSVVVLGKVQWYGM